MARPRLDPEQQRILNALLAEGRNIRDPRARRVYERAAVQTGLVESGLRNLSGGDADSAGWRQERASLYPNPTNVGASARRFRQEFEQHYQPGEKSYEVAAQVQRPAAQYRGRYKDVASQAAAILRGAGGGTQAGTAAPAGTPSSGAPVDLGQAADASALISMLSGQQRQSAPSGALPTPAVTAGPALPERYAALSSGQAPKPRQDIGPLLALAQTQGGGVGTIPGAQSGATGAQTPSADPGGVIPLGGRKNAGEGKFTISGPNPDRLRPELTSFANKVADVFGGTLGGLDGSTHSKMTVNGNVSEHYTGNATDIFTINGKPAEGARLLRAGRAALIAAGMPRKQALKAGGGLYNVGNHQIIFLTNEGGNHYDHLHISTHARRR